MLMNVLIGDLTAILGLIEFVRPDKLVLRYFVARKAPTQAEMNQIYALDSEFYLPFRYQLVLKTATVAFIFCPAMPILLPFAAIHCYVSYWVDRYNLLRVFKPPPRTTDRTVTMSVLYILPFAVFGHMIVAIFFYSKQAHRDVPLAYYLGLCFLAILVMIRISGALSTQSQQGSRDAGCKEDPAGRTPSGVPFESNELRAHLHTLEMYIPPLSTMLLRDTYMTAAAKASSSFSMAAST